MFDEPDLWRKLAIDTARFGGLVHLARPLVGAVGVILMLHRVTELPAHPLGFNRHLRITPRFLDQLICCMKASGYSFVSLDEIVDALRHRSGTGRLATITADDGYRDNLTEALPVFETHATPFTIYIAPGLVDGAADLWWDILEEIVAAAATLTVPGGGAGTVVAARTRAEKGAALRRLAELLGRSPRHWQRALLAALARQAGIDFSPPRPGVLMAWPVLVRLAAHPLATIGAHTIHHVNLCELPAAAARDEMAQSVSVLGAALGRTPRHFAYPYGNAAVVGEREIALAGELGFASAVTTRHGVLLPGHGRHLLALPRISVNGRFQNLGRMGAMLSGLTTPLANRGRRLVTV